METTMDGTFFQEEDHVRVKSTGETARVNAVAGGIAYVLMDQTNESRYFAAFVDEDAAIELVETENMTVAHDATPFSVQLSEQWLLDRTYHAQLLNGRELSSAHLTRALQQLTDVAIPLSSQSSISHLPEHLPLQKSRSFSIPISTWQEITQTEARTTYQQGQPVLLYSERTWEHTHATPGIWRPNQNMRAIINGNTISQPDATSGTEYATCYLDIKQGIFSTDSWKAWFSSDPAGLFAQADPSITFLRPYVQFPFTTRYTLITPVGRVSEYPDHTRALAAFVATPLQEIRHGNTVQILAPLLSYYHEVTCPSGTYRLDFFGPHMHEPGYNSVESAMTPA